MKLVKYIKHNTQNLIDFVITNYGNVDSVFNFLSSINASGYSDFGSADNKVFQLNEIPSNAVTAAYQSSRNVVSSVGLNEYVANLVCNQDLSFKTLVGGDFNDDFNNDFDRPSLGTVVVGYEGMDLYCIFSVTNQGSKGATASGNITLTNNSTITTVKPFSAYINAGETYTFTLVFNNVSAGLYDVTVSGGCTQTKSIEVLGSVVFSYNNDLSVVEPAPYTQNDTITINWSVDNTGSANGLYTGYYTVNANGNITQYPVSTIISASGTYTFEQSVILNEFGFYQFGTNNGDFIQISVAEFVSSAIIEYNNDLQIVESPINNGDTITVRWSMTNNGSESGTTQGYIEYYPDDTLNRSLWNTTPTTINAGQTVTFEKTFKVYGGDREIRLTGDAIDTLNFTVLTSGNYKFVFWTDQDLTPPFEPILSNTEWTIPYTQFMVFHVRIVNDTLGNISSNVKMRWNDNYLFHNYTQTVLAESYKDFGTGLQVETTGRHNVKCYLDDVLVGIIYYNVTN